MALCLLRSRLGTGRSIATGIAKAVSGRGTNATKTVSYLRNVRRFSAGAGNNNNNNNSGKITKACLMIGAGLAVNGLVLGCYMEKYVDKRLASLEASHHAASSLSDDEAKAELRRYVDGKFSEAQGLAKAFQAEARAGVLQSRQHVDNVISRLEHDLRILAQRRLAEEKKLAELAKEVAELSKEIEQIHRLARIRKQYDDSAEKNSRVLAEQQAEDGKMLAELTKEIEQVRGEVRSCDRKLNSTLSQQHSRVADERKYAELSSEFAELRQQFQNTDRKLNTALSQGSSLQAASEKKLAELTREIKQVRGEVRSCYERLNSALSQQNSQSANERDYAELSSEVAKLRQEFQKTIRKMKAGSEGMSAECRNEIARLGQEIRSINVKLNSRASSDGFFTECSNEMARLRQKVIRLEGIVDRLAEDSRKPPSDPGVGPSAPKPKKYKQD